jgi:hypothetical protein
VKLKASVFLASAVVSSAAFAQEAKMMDKLEKMVTPYGILQGTLTLSDTQANNTPAAALNVARFGLKVSEGIAKGQLEIQFTGNSETQTNQTIVRRADAGFDFASGTSFRLGRYRLGGAGGWGVDASGTVTGFGPADGAMIAQSVDLGEGNMLKFQLGLANTLAAAGSWATGGSSDFSSSGSSKGDRAILASLDATVAGVALAAYYGYEAKRTLGIPDNTNTATIDESTAKIYSSLGHLEVSAGYNMDGIGAGVWYERYDIGKPKAYVANNANIIDGPETIAGTVTGSRKTASRIGLGVNGDSSLFDVTDLAQKGDKLTYGLSYVLTQVRDSKQPDSDEKKNDESQIAGGVGYNVAGLTTELNFSHVMSKNKNYKNPNATVAKASAQSVYLTSIYSF